jgi:hypothetical protein
MTSDSDWEGESRHSATLLFLSIMALLALTVNEEREEGMDAGDAAGEERGVICVRGEWGEKDTLVSPLYIDAQERLLSRVPRSYGWALNVPY